MELKKVSFSKAADICADIELSEEARELLTEASTPSEYLQQLIDSDLTQDGIKFLARALPRREATWWACVSARQATSEATDAEHINTLELAEQWVYKPTDANRYAAHDAGENLPNESPVFWTAMATFWSGGSVASPDVPPVPPADNTCSMAVAGAVTLAGLDDKQVPDKTRYELFFKQGIAIANGDNAKQVGQ